MSVDLTEIGTALRRALLDCDAVLAQAARWAKGQAQTAPAIFGAVIPLGVVQGRAGNCERPIPR